MLARFEIALRFEGEITQDDERFEIRGVELVRTLGGFFSPSIVAELAELAPLIDKLVAWNGRDPRG